MSDIDGGAARVAARESGRTNQSLDFSLHASESKDVSTSLHMTIDYSSPSK